MNILRCVTEIHFTGMCIVMVRESVASKPTDKSGKAKTAVAGIFLQTNKLHKRDRLDSKAPAKTGEVNPDFGERVASKPDIKCAEAKPAVGERVPSKPLTKCGDVNSAVGERVASKP